MARVERYQDAVGGVVGHGAQTLLTGREAGLTIVLHQITLASGQQNQSEQDGQPE